MDRPDHEKLDQRVRAGLLQARRDVALRECLIPNCSTGAPIIGAHSIQQAGALGRIAQDGHIYMFRPQATGNGLVRLGVNRASVFTGFCAEHDNELFRSVDFDEFKVLDVANMDQIVRLSLRAVACEYWKKQCAQRVYSRLHELSVAGRAEEMGEMLNLTSGDVMAYLQFNSRYARAALEGTNDAIARLRRWFLSLLSQLQAGKYHLSRACTFQIVGEPLLAASAAFPVEWDLHGTRITTMRKTDDIPDAALNVVPDDGGSIVTFLWHRRFDRRLTEFFTQLAGSDSQQQRTFLGKLIIMRCENVALAPKLVDSWTVDERTTVVDLFCSTLARSRPFDRAPQVRLFGT